MKAAAHTLLSPRGFAAIGAWLVVAYFVAHLAGLREHAAILSGTLPAGGGLGIALGVAYVLAYFACVIAAPILLYSSILQ